MRKLRILLADDHAIIRDGLKLLINAQPDMEVVGEASNGRIACEQAEQLRPDILVMDLSMPGGSGGPATEQLKRICPEVKVLILTVHDDEDYLRQLLRAGAQGYVLKRAAGEELTRAIRTIAEGNVYLDSSLTSKVLGNYLRKPTTQGERTEAELSDREEEVLRLIAWGYANKEIAAKLYISVKTVETYKARLMEKLNLHTRADLVRYALRQGWLQEQP